MQQIKLIDVNGEDDTDDENDIAPRECLRQMLNTNVTKVASNSQQQQTTQDN